MGFWDKVKDAAQKAADAAKEQVQAEGSLLNKTIEGAKSAADKAVVLAKDQANRQDSGLNNVRGKIAGASDNLLGKIDAIDAGQRDDQVQMAKRYAAKRKAETMAGLEEEPEPVEAERDRGPKFPNSHDLSDDEVYKSVSETIYPDFRTLPSGDKKWALCEIARYDKKLANLMREIGNGYIDTVRQLAEEDDGYTAVLDASGLAHDPELRTAYRNWLDDSYDDAFYQDDDGGQKKAVRLIGWLVFQLTGGVAGEAGGLGLSHAFTDAGVQDVYSIARNVGKARTLLDARDAVVMQAFKPRRASFQSQFLVLKGINADTSFTWLESGDGSDSGSDDDGGGFSGGSLMEL